MDNKNIYLQTICSQIIYIHIYIYIYIYIYMAYVYMYIYNPQGLICH